MFFNSAVTNMLALPRFAASTFVPPSNTPFSRSACTHGPACGLVALSFDRFSASMCPTPVSTSSASTLPKSEQHLAFVV